MATLDRRINEHSWTMISRVYDTHYEVTAVMFPQVCLLSSALHKHPVIPVDKLLYPFDRRTDLYEGKENSSRPSLRETRDNQRWVGTWTEAGVTATLRV